MAETAYGEPAAVGQDAGPTAGKGTGAGTAARTREVCEGAPRRQTARESAARTYPRALPIVPVRARGLIIEGADGRRYLDCVSGAGALALGHNHPVVLEAIRKVLDSGAPLQVMDLTTPVEEAFVTELSQSLPPGLAGRARVRFCGPSATDAVEAAVAFVRAATGRSRVVSLAGARHGTAAGEPVPGGGRGDGVLVRPRLPQDHGRPRGGEGDAGSAARRDESVLGGHLPGQTAPAGLIVAPVDSEAGVVPAPDAWMRHLRRLTAERSVPLIVDETETGAGRTGAFWAVEHSGTTPDVLVLSKAIGGSLPLAAIVHRDDLCAGEPGAGTFRGNQLALAAGTATLAHIRANRLAEHAAALGAGMLARLRGLGAELPCVGEVRGRGLMLGVELVTPDGEGGAAPRTAAAVQRECLRRGLVVDRTGPSANVVRLLPPLTITEDQAAAVLERLADALRTVAATAHRPVPATSGEPREPR
ncbi:aminotransferase class III-fold pyridoxal phosphate-dependent enzyme [Streptomyces sp. NPDC006384]|uniref:aminotransferase class III-fold pyridoxal phosphate-dependent enzyme n=1 Tax=Streptomyces sp. NPDC006384 TaxID=3364745 RepID=UPI0036CA4120